jgi:hypothetical protein
MPDSGRIAAVIERVRTLEWQAHALLAPIGDGDFTLAVDNALTALSLIEAALRDSPEDELLASLEDAVDDIGDRLRGLRRSR